MDSQAGLDFLLSRRDIDRKKIIVFGRSLGGAVAIYLAASHANRDKWDFMMWKVYTTDREIFAMLNFSVLNFMHLIFTTWAIGENMLMVKKL